MLFAWKFYFLPLFVHVKTNVTYLALCTSMCYCVFFNHCINCFIT
jgi:hypothetical protein